MDGLEARLPSDQWGKRFLFSVIVPVYNTEEFLEETIQSVIRQTVGFAENIQLILVNNATPDGAGAICMRYHEQYPYNIVYIELPENRGPSGARNAGIPYIRGQYVNFLDSDDKWDTSAFRHVANFLNKHSELDVAVARKRYFDAWGGWFYDDKYFNKTRVVSIFQEERFSQFWIGAVFFRSGLFKQVQFDIEAKYSEDIKFVSEILLDTQMFGVVREAIFYYRKRSSSALSQVQVQRMERYWYFEAPERSHQYLIKLSIQRFERVILYIQHVIMQEIAWRITQKKLPPEFTPDEILAYKEKLRALLQFIDDPVILTASIWKEYKLACLRLKYGFIIQDKIELHKGKYVLNNYEVFSGTGTDIVVLLDHQVVDHTLTLEARVNFPFPESEYRLTFEDESGNVYASTQKEDNYLRFARALGECCMLRYRVKVCVPLPSNSCVVYPYFSYQGIKYRGKFGLAPQERLCRQFACSFAYSKGTALLWENGGLRIVAASNPKQFEQKIQKELFRLHHKRALAYRILAPILRQGKKNWILVITANEFGEETAELKVRAIERVLAEKPGETKLFIVCKNKEWDSVKQFGTRMEPQGLAWTRMVFSAEMVLAFQWNNSIAAEPFGWHTSLVKDLLYFRRVDLNDFMDETEET